MQFSHPKLWTTQELFIHTSFIWWSRYMQFASVAEVMGTGLPEPCLKCRNRFRGQVSCYFLVSSTKSCKHYATSVPYNVVYLT